LRATTERIQDDEDTERTKIKTPTKTQPQQPKQPQDSTRFKKANLVPDVSRAVRILEGRDRLLEVCVGRRHTTDHHSAAVATLQHTDRQTNRQDKTDSVTVWESRAFREQMSVVSRACFRRKKCPLYLAHAL
jgi:hypothetical protein